MSYRDPQGPLDVGGFVQRLENIRGVLTGGNTGKIAGGWGHWQYIRDVLVGGTLAIH